MTSPTRRISLTRWRYDFRTGMPDAGLFPYQTWRALVTRELRVTRGRDRCVR